MGGSELAWGTVMSLWLLGMAIGSRIGVRAGGGALGRALAPVTLLLTGIGVLLFRAAPALTGVASGETVTAWQAAWLWAAAVGPAGARWRPRFSDPGWPARLGGRRPRLRPRGRRRAARRRRAEPRPGAAGNRRGAVPDRRRSRPHRAVAAPEERVDRARRGPGGRRRGQRRPPRDRGLALGRPSRRARRLARDPPAAPRGVGRLADRALRRRPPGGHLPRPLHHRAGRPPADAAAPPSRARAGGRLPGRRRDLDHGPPPGG